MTSDAPETRERVEEAAATWIAKRGRGSWTSADEAALDAWLADSAGHRVAYYRLNAAWDQAERLGEGRRRNRFRVFAAAASVMLVLAGTVVTLQMGLFRPTSPPAPPAPVVAQTVEAPAADPVAATAMPSPAAEETRAAPPEPAIQQRYRTAIGVSQSISLLDGSRVMLDTDSEIRVSMAADVRTVQLERGQAFFDVASDPRRPFVVNVDRVSVVAVGTQFSVRRVAADIRVVVAEGTVRLGRNGLVSAGGMARIEGDVVEIRQGQPAEVGRTLSWRSGVLTFRHTPLAEAVAEFNRYDTRQIVIRDPAVAALEVGGVFRSGDAEAFARLLERTFPIEAAIQPDRIELAARSTP